MAAGRPGAGEAGLGAALRGEGARADAAREAGWRRTARAERVVAAYIRALDAEPVGKGMRSCLGRRPARAGEISWGARVGGGYEWLTVGKYSIESKGHSGIVPMIAPPHLRLRAERTVNEARCARAAAHMRSARGRDRRGRGRGGCRGAARPQARSARTRGRATRSVSSAIGRGRGSPIGPRSAQVPTTYPTSTDPSWLGCSARSVPYTTLF